LNADGSVLAAGGRYNNNAAGVVRVYDMNLKDPIPTHHAFYGSVSYGFFGSSVSLSANGKRILIGELGHNRYQGKAYIFDYDDVASQWKSTATASFTGDKTGDALGEVVSLSGDGTVAALRYGINNRYEFLVFDGACPS